MSNSFTGVSQGEAQKKRGRIPNRQKGRLRHLGLELLGIIKKVTPALVEICVSMAVLCPSFEVAANALQGLGIEMNQNLLQNITHRFANLAMTVRVDCHAEEAWQKPGINIRFVSMEAVFGNGGQNAVNGRTAKNDKGSIPIGLSRDCCP